MKIKYFMFSVITIFISVTFILITLLAIDMYYHNKYLNWLGLNYKGYRGKVLHKKQPNEVRLAVLGGSAVFGYCIKYTSTIPYQLENKLQKQLDALGYNRKISVANLAYNSEGAYAFYYNLNDFFYLDYDYVILYSDYNDLGVGNAFLYRHSNPFFRTFGYMPILQLLAFEKLMLLKNGGQWGEAYWGKKVVFTPTLKGRIKISILDNALKAYNSVESYLGRIKKMKNLDFDAKQLEKDKFSWFKYFMKKAIDFCLERNKKVIVVTAPYISEFHITEQESLRNMLSEVYRGNKNVLYINLGESFSLKDEKMSFDGMHLTYEGCEKIADMIANKIGEYVCKDADFNTQK